MKSLQFQLSPPKCCVRNGALSVSVFQVVDVAQKLQFVIHSGNDGVHQAVGDESHLLVVIGIATRESTATLANLVKCFWTRGVSLKNLLKSNEKYPFDIIQQIMM